MIFNNIDEVLNYLCNSINKDIAYSEDKLVKTKNLLTKFIHCPKMSHPEIRNYGSETMVRFKKTHPNNKVVNSKAYEIMLFDYDENLAYFVTFGDVDEDNTFKVEADVCDIEESTIKSNRHAIELLKRYYTEVEYETMNDSVNYGSTYRRQLERKYELNGAIIKMFQNFYI